MGSIESRRAYFGQRAAHERSLTDTFRSKYSFVKVSL